MMTSYNSLPPIRIIFIWASKSFLRALIAADELVVAMIQNAQNTMEMAIKK